MFWSFFFVIFTFLSGAQAEQSWTTPPDVHNRPHWTVPLQNSLDWQEDNAVRYSNPYADVFASKDDEGIALELSRYASKAIPRIAKQLGISTGGPLQIYLAQSQSEFMAMQPNLPPDWADGTAWPKNGWIFLRSPRIRPLHATSLHTVLDHEIVHILLGRAFAHRDVPRWLQEGVAQVVAGEFTPEKVDQLGSFAEPMSFLELAKGFPKDALQAQMAYAQSASLVAFMFQNFGLQSLQILIEEMSVGTDLDLAMLHATGLNPAELDVAWRGRTYAMPLWIRNLSMDGTLLGALSLIILLGALRKYKITRQPVDIWEYEEKVHQQLIQEMASWDRPIKIYECPRF